MSTMWTEDLDLDAEYDDDVLDDDWDGEDADDLDWEDESYLDGEDAESRASRRRRARSRRIAMARRRQALARSRAQTRFRTQGRVVSRPRPSPAPVRRPASAVAAIRSVDLEAKVADDGLRRELAAQRNRMNRSDYTAVAGLAVNQFMDSFDQPQNAYLRALLRAAPLMLLSPQRRGDGFGAFVTDPRVIGGAAAVGIAFLGEQRDKGMLDAAAPTTELAKGTTTHVLGQVVAANGTPVPGPTVQWDTSDSSIATVDSKGVVTAGQKSGWVFIVAKAEGLPDKRVPIFVK